eukprot:UN05394
MCMTVGILKTRNWLTYSKLHAFEKLNVNWFLFLVKSVFKTARFPQQQLPYLVLLPNTLFNTWQTSNDCEDWEDQPEGWLCEGDGRWNDEDNCIMEVTNRRDLFVQTLFDKESSSVGTEIADIFRVECDARRACPDGQRKV